MVAQLMAYVQLLAHVARVKALVLPVPEALGAGDLGAPVTLPVPLSMLAWVVL